MTPHEIREPELGGTVYRFGSFELDPGLYALRRDGVDLDVQPKVLDVLLYLVARRDRVVSREEILDALWPGIAATDDVLSRAIHAARQAVGDDGGQQGIIQTVRRRGFRFVAAIDSVGAPPPLRARATAEPAPTRPGAPFAGRERELQRLRDALDDVRRGHGRITLVSGEAGGGKTRLIEEFIRQAAAPTARVYSGWCWEGEGVQPYWLWVQILRAVIAHRSADELREQMGTRASDIARVIPSLREKLPELSESQPIHSDQERFRLFDSISGFLRSVAERSGPLILALDDLQWADAPSLRLIEFLAHDLSDAAIFVLGAYREEEVEHPLSETLGALARRPIFEQLSIKGLSPTEIAQILRATSGEPADELVSAVAEKTDGNPFLVTEIAQLIKIQPTAFKARASGSGSFALPQGLTAVVQRRLAMLPPSSHRVLALAAVIGREFSRETLLQALDLELRGAPLAEALRSSIVAAVPGSLGRYRFSHGLVREALYEEIEASERARLHRRVAEALEQMPGMSSEANLIEIAFHYTESASPTDFEKAIVFAKRAGERAAEQLAWEDASSHFRDAMQLLEQREARTANERCQLLLAIAESERRSGNLSRAREACAHAAKLAKRFDLREVLGRAALGVETPFDIVSGSVDPLEVELIEDALRIHTDPQSLTRARLLGRLAVARFWNNDSALCLALTDEAIDIARRSGDPSALAEALIAQVNVMSRPAFMHRQMELSDEIARLAYESGNLSLIYLALLFRMEEYLARGDSARMRHDLPEIRRVAEELRQPPERSFVMMIDATSLLYQGHIAEAARVGREALDLGALGGDPYYQITRTLHRYGVFYEQQRLERLEDEIRHLAETHRPGSMWFCALANLCSLIGKRDEARNLFEALALGSFASVSQDFGWPTSMYHLSDLCARLGDAKRAAVLYDQLLPHAKRNMVFSWMAFYGPASRYLGLLAATMESRERASEHFEDAIQSSNALGAALWTARARCDYARFLLGRGEPDQRAKARAMIERVTHQAAEMDSACLAAEVASLAEL